MAMSMSAPPAPVPSTKAAVPESPDVSDKYHLVLSYGCPFCQRVAITRVLKGLADVIAVDVVEPYAYDDGFRFSAIVSDVGTGSTVTDAVCSTKGVGYCYRNTINEYRSVNEFYDNDKINAPHTIPFLYDVQQHHIVTNDTGEIMKMMNTEFQHTSRQQEVNIYPVKHAQYIDEMCAWLDVGLCKGVYAAGDAQCQDEYDAAVDRVFDTLDKMDVILSKHKYIAATEHVSIADIYAYTALYRFDAVYYILFKCCKKRLTDYRYVSAYARRLHYMPAFRNTSDMKQCLSLYYSSNKRLNPSGILPRCPECCSNLFCLWP